MPDETLTFRDNGSRPPGESLKTWGSFELLEMVGRGSFGEVYRAFDTVLQREVALKLLVPGGSSAAEEAKEILREARLMAKVRHPNVVIVHGVDTFEGRVGFWSDFVKGRTLSSLLDMQGPFGPRETALIGIDLCKALSAVHGAGLLHRDIKAGNAMREEGGRILLMDFGLTRTDQEQHHFAGTPSYMAPELFTQAPASVASDIYSMGVLLYHLLTGRYPVDAPTLKSTIAAHNDNQRRSLYDERPDLPEKLVQAIETAIRKDPKDRFQSAGQLLAALSESLGAGSTESTGQNPLPSSVRTFPIWMALPIMVLLAAAVWFTPLHKMLPLHSAGPQQGAGAHALYLKAQENLEAYYRPGNIEKAIDGFQKTIDLESDFALGYGGLCRAWLLRYRDTDTPEFLANARAACSKAVQLDHDLASVHVTMGMLYTSTSRNDLAAQEMQEALRLDSKNAEAYGALAELYTRQGRTKDVVPAFQKAEDLAPTDWRWPNQLGLFYRTSGRFDDAVKQYQTAVRLTPDNSHAWNSLGITYRRQGRFDEARAAFSKAIELDPVDYYYSNLGLVLEQQGDDRGAVDLYLKAIKLNPTSYTTWANLASVYDRIPGEKARARESYLKAISLAEQVHQNYKGDATFLSRLGSWYATLGMEDKSLPLLRQAAALEPENPEVLYRAGEGYELLHQRDEALRWIGMALAHKYSLEALKRNPEMAALIADQRFQAMAAKVK